MPAANDHQKPLDDLLLQCSLPAPDLPQLFHSMQAAVGWERFLRAAEYEGLAGLIFANCRKGAPGLIPPPLWRSFEHSYLATLARNTLSLAKFDQIALALAGLDFIALKGVYLVSQVYPSLGLRGFSDIDILVRLTDLAEIQLRLAKIGYRPVCPGLVSPAHNYAGSMVFYPAGNEITLDVHWHLLNSMAAHYLDTTMDLGEIWKAARPCAGAPPPEAPRRQNRLRLSGGAGWELCPEHLIIHLAEHALHHSFERLILLRDIAEVILKFGGTLDWNRLTGECLKFNLARPVYYSLLMISLKTRVPVPAPALAALRPARLGRAERLLIGLVLRGRRFPESCNLAYFDRLASGRARIRFVWSLFFPCRAVMALTYGRRLDQIGPGIYILRWFHGLRYVVRGIFHYLGRIDK